VDIDEVVGGCEGGVGGDVDVEGGEGVGGVGVGGGCVGFLGGRRGGGGHGG